MKRLILLFLILLVPGSAFAQAQMCSVPAQLPAPKRQPTEERRIIPVGAYTLALSWSPEYCRTRRDDAGNTQCNGRVGRFGFILHGLWPDGAGSVWPQYCRPVNTVPQSVARATLCTTPSVDLQQHEWEKHGSCAFTDAGHYFRASRIMYGAVRYPDMDALSRNPSLTVGTFSAEFARANAGLSRDMLRVNANERGWLEEVWICLDKRMRPRRCPATGKANGESPLRIWRGKR
jgi:ribonuclease T2